MIEIEVWSADGLSLLEQFYAVDVENAAQLLAKDGFYKFSARKWIVNDGQSIAYLDDFQCQGALGD